MAERTPRRNFSPQQKSLYTFGLLLQGVGAVGFLVCFLGFALGGKAAVDSRGQSGDPMAWWIGALVCMVLIVVGGFLRSLAARGAAGSGLVLDAEQARRDLEPWARMGGGMVKDALDEAGIGPRRRAAAPPDDGPAEDGSGSRGTPVTAIKCGHCHTLNDDDAKFCDECGAQL